MHTAAEHGANSAIASKSPAERSGNSAQRFFAWPDWSALRLALELGTVQYAWWWLMYGGASYLTGLHGYRVRLHFDAELAVPFVPASAFAYLSILPLFWLTPFIVRTRRGLVALNGAQAIITLVASAFFLAFPGWDAFPPEDDVGTWSGVVWFARSLALTNNYAPSLHVALGVFYAAVFARRAGLVGRLFFGGWALLIAVATLLLHQHYLVDVITGAGLGYLGFRSLYVRWVGKR